MIIPVEELKKSKTSQYDDGYRIVYFYDNKYSIGEYCKKIDGFMLSFAKCYPIMDEDDIPKFISEDDLLERYLNSMSNITGVGIYKIDGTCIHFKERNQKKIV